MTTNVIHDDLEDFAQSNPNFPYQMDFENYDLEKNYSKMLESIILKPLIISRHYEATCEFFYDNFKNDWDWDLSKIKIGRLSTEEIIIDLITVYQCLEGNILKNLIRYNIKNKYNVDIKYGKPYTKQYYRKMYS
jgi:hypothetical protein